jgi:DNA-binding transcriptional regulator GbsR (MarR family)
MEEEIDYQFEARVVEFFCDGVRMLGLPKSVGEIYGLLFISQSPLSLDDLVNRLGISKGSASQGLKMLRELGAVKEAEGDNLRRSYFQPDVELKRLARGFIKEQVRPHLASGDGKLADLKRIVREAPDSEGRQFYHERLDQLERWSKKASVALPLLQRFLGR